MDQFEGLPLSSVHRCGQQAMKHSVSFYSQSITKDRFFFFYQNSLSSLHDLLSFFRGQMFKLILEKAKEAEIKLPTSAGSSKKRESSRKTSTSALLTKPKPLTVWIKTEENS